MEIWNGFIRISEIKPIDRKPCCVWKSQEGGSGQDETFRHSIGPRPVCQQALANRLDPIFEKVFDPSSFGYRTGRKTADALAKSGVNWRPEMSGS